MVGYIFVVSATLLVFFTLVRFLEVARGIRFGEERRVAFDAKVTRSFVSLRHMRMFLVREAGARAVHALVYRALMLVRFFERILDEGAVAVRAQGRKARAKRLEEKRRILEGEEK
jgi:hypothetical protein